MIATLRSRLLRTAMLAFAVLFSQTANAAKPGRTIYAPPATVKLCAAWPESRNDFKSNIKKAQRPQAAPLAHGAFSVAGFLSAGAAALEVSHHVAVAFDRQQLADAAPQFRIYALRI